MASHYARFRRRPYIPKVKKHEESIQIKVARYLRKNYPGVEFHSDYAAGMMLSQNQAKIRKSLNSGRGWSDMFIACPSKGYLGLFIELKKDGTAIYVRKGPRKGELVKSEQIEIEACFLNKMNSLGYLARFAVGYDQAIKLIDGYFGRLNGTLL